jgi:hypothetical protein
MALLTVLDPFSDHPQAETVSEIGDGGHDA